MTSSSTPSTLPVMSNSCLLADSRIVTTVGVVEKYIITAMKNVVPCDNLRREKRSTSNSIEYYIVCVVVSYIYM